MAILTEREYQLAVQRNWDYALKAPDPFKVFRELQEAIEDSMSPVEDSESIDAQANAAWLRAE